MTIEDYKKYRVIPPKKHHFGSGLACGACGSTDIEETHEGYVCRACYVVLEEKKLEYHKPYNNDVVQYARLGTTQVGLQSERLRNPNSVKLERMNKIQIAQSYEVSTLSNAKREISRVFEVLRLSKSKKNLVIEKFKKIYGALRPGTKYRSFEKLVPLCIYFCFKYSNLSINEDKLLSVSKITKKEFNAFKLQVLDFFPRYQERNRQEYVLQKVLQVTERFKLDMGFYNLSKKVMYKLWKIVNGTKDTVVAGLVSSIAALCSYKDKVTVSEICKELNVKMSTIQWQVKKRIFERLRIEGFSTLVKSSEILRRVMVKLGAIEPEREDEAKAEVKLGKSGLKVVEVKLGNAVQTFNHYDNTEFYLFALANGRGTNTLVGLKIYEEKRQILGVDSKISEGVDKLFDLDCLSFPSKGPPLSQLTA